MEQSPSYKAVSSSPSQEISLLLWNRNVHYHIRSSPPLIPTLSQINPIHTLCFDYFETHFNIIFTATPIFPSWFFLTNSHQISIRSSVPHICPLPRHPMIDLLTLMIFGEHHKFLQSNFTSSLLDPTTSLSTQFPHTLSLYSSRHIRDQVSHPYKTTGKLWLCLC